GLLARKRVDERQGHVASETLVAGTPEGLARHPAVRFEQLVPAAGDQSPGREARWGRGGTLCRSSVALAHPLTSSVGASRCVFRGAGDPQECTFRSWGRRTISSV